MDLLEVAAPASAGQPVLAPPREIVDASLAVGLDAQPFVFARATLAEPGADASVLTTRSGRRDVIPNPLIVPLGDEIAAPGDLVVAPWGSGSGMQRAVVVAVVEAARPRVFYLDAPAHGTPGWARREEVVDPGTFRVLTAPGDSGTTVACLAGDQWQRFVSISVVGDRRVVVGYAGRLAAFPMSSCRPLALRPEVGVGDAIFAAHRGRFVPSRVVRLEPERHRAIVERPGVPGEVGVPLLDVLVSLPGTAR